MKRLPLFLIVLTLCLTSCISEHRINRTYFRPDDVRLEMSMSDFEYLGKTTIDVEYKTYFGIFRKILSINGIPYNHRYHSETRVKTDPKIRVGSVMRRGMYKVIEDYPDADYVIPTQQQQNYEHMFMGRVVHKKLTVKVYKLRE